jgi:RNA polymerase sigma-70 factor (ECF subfamily)
LRIVQSLPRYRAEGRLSHWVRGICVHVVRDHWRRQKVRQVITTSPDVETLLAQQPDVGDRVEARRLLQLIQAALDTLSPAHRMVFVLKNVLGHSTEEIAELTQSAHSTTRMRLYYARRAMAKALERLQPHAPAPPDDEGES